jgi:uroporphyrinogen decarboxylase
VDERGRTARVRDSEAADMTPRDRFLSSVTFGEPDRLILTQFYGYMPGVMDRWQSEGMPEPRDDWPLEELGLDDTGEFTLPVNLGPVPAEPERILHDDDETRISTDALGRRMRLIKRSSTLPLPMEFPVKNMADWLRLKPRFSYCPERLPEGWIEHCRQAPADGRWICFRRAGFFHFPRELMGDLALGAAYYEQPELVRDILETYTELVMQMAEHITANVAVDVVATGEDFAYKAGPFMSPRTAEEFIIPYYLQVNDFFSRRGTKVFLLDSDGQLEPLMPLLLEAGINAIAPFEVQAGMDIAAARRKYGRSLAILGGIDKLAIARGREAIERELEARLPPVVKTGGYVGSLDHRVVIETSYADFLYYIARARDYLSRR